MKKRCREAEEHERNDNNNNNNNNTKKKTTLSISPAEAAATWSELPLDALGEIKKKLFWGDHVRFSSVCKTWLSAQLAKRASDVLPWLLLLDRENLSRVSYYMYEPSASHPDPVISQVSTNPTSPDCVFLALHITNAPYVWSISTFRHGDTRWTTTLPFGGWYNIPDVPCVEDVVFIRGVFYFLFLGGRLGSYDIATMQLKLEFPNLQDINKFDKFFLLDEELIVTYFDEEASYCIRRLDWSDKVWVPVESLKDRSLFLSKHSVFVDIINCYGDGINYDPESFKGETAAGNKKISIWVEPPDHLQQQGLPESLVAAVNGGRPPEQNWGRR
ncbi:F-box/kelch-repeat protein At1g57790-like [Apium graveolens]|uniref:F-box/kelch-repeat protein At1g57790-like n=1 Tax=Apium graveolens TaxID=4045 RepID=UPI003D7B7BE0